MSEDDKLDAIAKSITALSTSIEGVKTDFRTESRGTRELFRRSEEKNLAAHAASRRHMARLTSMTTELWRFNFGDRAPPPPPPGSSHDEASLSAVIDTGPVDEKGDGAAPPAPSAPVRDRMKSQEGELAELAGNVIRVASDVDVMRSKVDAVEKIGNELLRLQKEQMGKKDPSAPHRDGVKRIADAFIWAATEREGQKYVGTVASGVMAFVTIVVMFYSLITGRPPPIFTPPAAVSSSITRSPHVPN